MLQIIGWLMCAYLVVKALELFGHAAHSERGKVVYNVGGVLSLICAPIFYFMMEAQVTNSAMPDVSASAESAVQAAASEAAIEAEAMNMTPEEYDAMYNMNATAKE